MLALQVVPPHTTAPGAKNVRFQYPFSACSVMLPLTPENGYTPEVVFFGGQYGYGWTTTPASDLALRLRVSGVEWRGQRRPA